MTKTVKNKTINSHSLACTFLLISALLFSSAQGAKLPLEQTDVVIKKLEHALSLSPKNVDQSALQVRLADLYAERARLKAIDEIKANKKDTESRKDRKTAIRYYQKAFRSSDRKTQERSLLQMAHLHRMIGETARATRLLTNTINDARRKGYSQRLIGLSYSGLGDISFEKGHYKSALSYYNKALAISQTPKRGFIHYRMGWCYLNSGRTRAAQNELIKILRSPRLLSQNGESQEIDKSFHSDVSRDLARFLARSPVGQQEINQLSDLSPEQHRIGNLVFLAQEAQRLGDSRSSLRVWKVVLNEKISTFDKIEGHVRLSEIHLALRQPKQALSSMKTAVELWAQNGCHDPDQCLLLKNRLRNFVTNWNKEKKGSPNFQISKAYAYFTSLFKEDVEMHYLAALNARNLKMWKTAADFYHQSASLAAPKVKSDPKDKDMNKLLTESLDGEIEASEASMQPKLRARAYRHYLDILPNGPQATVVWYQWAHLLYDQKQYKTAAEIFYKVALTKEKKFRDIQAKAADLSLDALALVKDDQKIRQWARSLTQRFPKKRTEFAKIERQAVLNIVSKLVNKNSPSQSDFKQALKELGTVSLVGASSKEKVQYYQNQMEIAAKLKDLKTCDRAAVHLLKQPSLDSRTKESALSRRVWVAELNFEFNRAYDLSQKLRLAKLGRAGRELKLATLAELAGKNPERHYERFIKLTPSRKKANVIRAKLIKRRGRGYWSLYQKYLGALNDTPSILAELTLDLYADYKDRKLINTALRQRGMIFELAGQVLGRQNILPTYRRLKRRIKNHKLRATSNYLAQKTLQERIDMLAKVEGLLNDAVRTKDWASQVLVIDLLADQNRRFYDEIIDLPAPRQLSESQAKQYIRQLRDQAEPYLQASKQLKDKVDDFWDNDKAVDEVAQFFASARPQIQTLVLEEMKELSKISPWWDGRPIRSALDERKSVPNYGQLRQAIAAVKKDPFNVSKISKLIRIQENRGADTMAGYLNSRKVDLINNKEES